MIFDEFINKWNNKGINFDGVYGDQCVDLINQYLFECLGIQNPIQILPGGTAYEIYKNSNSPLFLKTDNTPTGIPSKGDVMFWKPNIQGVTGSAGHVAIYINGDVNGFNSFDQNYPTGTKCHIQGHNYNGVAGWLRYKPQDQQAIIDQLRKERDDNWNKYQEALKNVTTWQNKAEALATVNYGLREDLKKIQEICKNRLNS